MPALALIVSVSGCFFYDSSWADAQAAKKRAKQRLHPARLGAGSGGATRSTAGRSALIRAYATRAYAVETLNWEQQFDALLREASAILEPAIGLTLENGGTSLWAPESGESAPTTAIGELAKQDSGDGVEWVVGFLQSVPKLVTDYDRLGVGRYFSKYLVVRGCADPKDMEYLEQFEGMSETERQRIYSERRRHRIVTVFLHELGHTLGATHRTAHDTIMSPRYDPTEKGFDDETLGVLKITLPQHLAGTPERAAGDLVSYFDQHHDGWVVAERDEWLAQLKSIARVTQASSPKPSPTATPTAAAVASEPAATAQAAPATALALSTLAASDRKTYESALALEKKSDTNGAWNTALPLFEKYLTVVEVQQLRCRLAKAKRFFDSVIEAHCSKLQALTGPASGH